MVPAIITERMTNILLNGQPLMERNIILINMVIVLPEFVHCLIPMKNSPLFIVSEKTVFLTKVLITPGSLRQQTVIHITLFTIRAFMPDLSE